MISKYLSLTKAHFKLFINFLFREDAGPETADLRLDAEDHRDHDHVVFVGGHQIGPAQRRVRQHQLPVRWNQGNHHGEQGPFARDYFGTLSKSTRLFFIFSYFLIYLYSLFAFVMFTFYLLYH